MGARTEKCILLFSSLFFLCILMRLITVSYFFGGLYVDLTLVILVAYLMCSVVYLMAILFLCEIAISLILIFFLSLFYVFCIFLFF